MDLALVQTIKMVGLVSGRTCLILVVVSFALVSAMRLQDERNIDYQYPQSSPELASLILDLVQRNEHATHKRNSEIINSLLGLPKVLNDAGRK